MEDSDDEENIQVIVFGNSTTANFDDFYKEEIVKDANIVESKNYENVNQSPPNDAQNEEVEQLDLDTQVLKATKDNKVFMKYEYTHEKPWLYQSDKSMWFNYNFDENSFKEWIQKHIDRRIEKQQNYQIENSDYMYNEKLRNNVNTTSAYEENLQNFKNASYKNQNVNNKMKYKNTKNSYFNNKNNMGANFNQDNISYTINDNNVDTHGHKNEDFYTHYNKNKLFDYNKDVKSGFTQSNNMNNYDYNDKSNNVTASSYGANNTRSNVNKVSNNSKSGSDSKDATIQNEDFKQLQNLINFFKENPEV